MKPTTEDLYRIIYVFEYLQHASYPYLATEDQREVMEHDKKYILERYNEHKWKPNMTFSAAMQIAKVEYMNWLFSGNNQTEPEHGHNPVDGSAVDGRVLVGGFQNRESF